MQERQSDFNDNILGDMLNQTLNNVKNMLTMQTFVGQAVSMGEDCAAYPIIKLTVGMVGGGGEYSAKKLSKKATRFPFAGGTASGFSAEPIGFLINNKGNVSFSTIESKNLTGEILKKLSEVLESYVENMLKNNKKEQNE